MPERREPPFHADHVGSLLRPPELLAARERHAAGELGADELRALEDGAVRAAVAMEEDIGLPAATDGEFRRASWHMDFIYQLGGVSKTAGNLSVKFRNATEKIEFAPPGMAVDGPVRLDHTIFADDFRFLAATTTTAVPKLTIPSPSMVHYRGGRAAVDETVYPDLDAFWTDLCAAYAAEIAALADLGCRYLQLDDTSLAYLNDPAQRAEMAARGEDADTQHVAYVRRINQAVADRPSTVALTTHLCRGNFRSSWVAEGGYDFVAEELFGELDVDGYFLEFDDERSGTFAPLRFVPSGKQVVLGLVTTKSGVLEDPEALKKRIDEAARYVPLEQLALSPQCGFSSTSEGNALTVEEQVAKLRLVVDVAADVWR